MPVIVYQQNIKRKKVHLQPYLVDIIASEFLRGLENGVGLTKDGETGPQVGSKVRLRRLFLRIA